MKPGDVVGYTPDEKPTDRWWCREGVAIVHQGDDGSLYALDTYWASAGDAHRLTPTELRSADVRFSLTDFRDCTPSERYSWKDHNPADRQEIPSQHGLQRRLLLRHDAKPDHATRIANAEAEVAKRAGDLATAERALDSARRLVDYLRTQNLTDRSTP